jgi:hypothetical protein
MTRTTFSRRWILVALSLALLAGSSAGAQAATSAPLTLSAKNQINFGRVEVGTTAYQTVTLTNDSSDMAIVSGAGVSAETGAFGLVFETVTCGGTLPPGASCSWTIAFTPPWRGNHVGQTDTLAATIAGDGSVLYTLQAKVKLIGWGT